MDNFGTAAILAGGKSTRMGFDKQGIFLDEKSLIFHQIDVLSREFSEIIVVTDTPENYAGLDCKTVSDEFKGKGPLGGIHVALKNAKSRYVYVLACDMPNINMDYIRFMKLQIERTYPDICITKQGEFIEPFNSFFCRDTVFEIGRCLLCDKKSIFDFAKKSDCLYISEDTAKEFSPDWGMFTNLNTREELDKYLKSVNLKLFSS
jgi:molybdopterin-guanine dinucleotide biosynthesis protein A